MIITRGGNTFWNAENNCWTEAKQAATEYKNHHDLPGRLPVDNNSNGTCKIEVSLIGHVTWHDEKDRAVAWTT